MAKIIIGLAGEMASGKGTVAQYLVAEKKASTHRFSTMLRDVLDRLHLAQSRDNLQKLSFIIRDTYGQDALAHVMAEDVKKDSAEVIVVDGVRRMDDIVFLKQIPEFKLVYIDVDIKTRYERIIKRSENPDDHDKTFEQFEAESKADAELQIAGLKEYADVMLDNNSDIENLYAQIDILLSDIE
jgi:dephospho-CoA kinase